MYDIKYDIKINVDGKNVSKVCKNNSRTAVKDNVTDVFLLHQQLINNHHENFSIMQEKYISVVIR